MKKGQTITLANYKTTVTNGTYNFASLTAATTGGTAVTTTTMGTSTTIALYYKRNTATVSLSKDANISSVTGAGTYKIGANVTVKATLGSATGYTISFKNWTGTSTSANNPYTFTMPASNVTLTANSTKAANSYLVTCIDVVDSTSGTELGRTTWLAQYQTTAYGSTAGSSTTVSEYYEGYTYSSCTSATVTTSGCTVYRIFNLKTYTITYNANGGTGAPSSQTYIGGETITLSTTEPTRTNYFFVGWATSSSATTATYSAGGTYTIDGDVTLYAVWNYSIITFTNGTVLDATWGASLTTSAVIPANATISYTVIMGSGGPLGSLTLQYNNSTIYYKSTTGESVYLNNSYTTTTRATFKAIAISNQITTSSGGSQGTAYVKIKSIVDNTTGKAYTIQ